MNKTATQNNAQKIAAAIFNEIGLLPIQDTPHIRAIRRAYSRQLKNASAKLVMDVARGIVKKCAHRWVGFELIHKHDAALRSIGEAELEEFAVDLNSWGAVDVFAGYLAGPAWMNGQIPDELIHQWARSPDRWWRRTALVCTVVLNSPSFGGKGDTRRTLAVCRLLVDDKDDMVVKAMSWALRRLIAHDRDAVCAFIDEHKNVLAARVKREVRNKLETGLKNPK
jgi:3-methyladenine DNA glycosylase AlkD